MLIDPWAHHPLMIFWFVGFYVWLVHLTSGSDEGSMLGVTHILIRLKALIT